MSDSSDNASDQSKAKRLAEECEQQLSAGSIQSEAEFLNQHPDLRDEIESELRKRRMVSQAINKAESGDSHHGDDLDRTVAVRLKDEVVCPECRQSIAIVDGASLGRMRCKHCQTEFNLVVDSLTQDESGRMIGQFQLVSLLGRGGFGSVWKAYDSKLDRYVAIKIPRRTELSPLELEQFLREARAAAQLSHPNIVSVLEVGEAGDVPFIACDLIEGEPLSPSVVRRCTVCGPCCRDLLADCRCT